ncbi:hypothetical protein [Paenibacillus sp. B1-33]|uniref:hypothetical protein n=1 Tax=unclassified Paenibacillus TaxID=185978 RepID=UPI003D2D9AE8
MKRYFVIFLMAALAVVTVVSMPMQTSAATDYRGGILDGVGLYLASDATKPGTLVTEVTDNNESTTVTMSGWNVGTNQDHIVKSFSEPVTVTSLRVSATKAISVGFYDKSGTYIKVNGQDLLEIPAEQADGRLIEIPETSGIYKVFLFNGLKESLDVREFNLYNNSQEPEPTPDPKPEPTPESGDRAILVVTMITGLEKEFDLSMDEVNAFITWYENKQAGSGTASYAIDKHNNNKGPFSARKDYVIFDKILTFEVNEYKTK